MAEDVVLSVDALGGDNAPQVVLDGVVLALDADKDLHVILTGPDDVVTPFATQHDRCEAQPTTQFIAMGEHPSGAVRTKKDSSLVVGARLVKEGAAQGFFSAGSTGACLAAATLVIGRIHGIKRPALGQCIPTYTDPTLLVDVGANADCKPEYLVQFAQMGVIYARSLMNIASPKVGLLNIGEEEAKGNTLSQETFDALSAYVPEFAGNCEPRNLLAGDFNVVVCDGFTGNVCLKTIESTAGTLFKCVKDVFSGSFKNRIGAALVQGDLRALRDTFSPDVYGGTPLLGVAGSCIVGHGSSNATAIKNGILVSATTVRSRLCEIIAESVANRVVSQADEQTENGAKETCGETE